MKKSVVTLFCLFALLLVGLTAAAQPASGSKESRTSQAARRQPPQDNARRSHHPQGGPHDNVGHGAGPLSMEEFIDDLTVQQKTMLDVITRKSAKKLNAYRTELAALRDTIQVLMTGRTDNSARLFPLYEREGRLQAEISKEFYRCKIAMDAVLTPDQYRRLQEALAANRPPDLSQPPAPPAKKAKK